MPYMIAMTDADKCFAYLRDDAPKWLEDLDRLEKQVEEKQQEMSKLPESPPWSDARGNSNPSIRDRDLLVSTLTSPETTPTSSSTSPPPVASFRPSHTPSPRNKLIKKSLRAGSMFSDMTARPKFRSRSMVTLYYNGEIQRAFEKLVREIGNGRNLIRKARIAARSDAFRSEELQLEELCKAVDDDAPSPLSMRGFRRTGSSSHSAQAPATGGSGVMSAYDQADEALERAQELCERAAHQFLRDGDCRLETRSAKEAFQDVVKISTEALAIQKDAPGSQKLNLVQLKTTQNPGQTANSPVAFTDIEVDDDADEVKLPPLRLTSSMGRRRG
jgi:hypothetical protein